MTENKDVIEEIPLRARTVAGEVSFQGRGIHTGRDCRIRILPAPAESGISFRRPGGAESVPALYSSADGAQSNRRTVLKGPNGERFEQVEHLMAALYAMGISDAIVEQEGPEVPFLDGGSRDFMITLREAGTTELEAARPTLAIDRSVGFQDGNALLVAAPHDGLRLSVFIEFPGTVVGCAGFTLEIDEESFFKEAAPARTFALAADVEKLRQAGLATGGTLENAVVFDHEKYYNDDLRFPDEVVRHKMIDLLGDLALLGSSLRGHFWGWRSGHRSHVFFAQFLAREFLTKE